ncbi:MAG: HAMP domain-containing protein [Pseudomonadales bacterium]|nr:HAMP domain-containing protein [Pseudomonadales bacterium]
MLSSRILWRLYAAYVVIILISTSVVGILINRQVTETSLADIQNTLAASNDYLSEIALHSLSTYPNETRLYPALQSVIRTLGERTKSRLTIVSIEGIVIADSQEDPDKMDNHLNRPEIKAAKVVGYGTATRFSQTLQLEMMYRAQAVISETKLLGYVRVSLPLTVINHRQIEIQKLVLISAVIAGIIALILGFYFARSFTNPLIKMTEVAEAISRGEYDKRIQIDQYDEIGQLAKAFNRMAISSSERIADIINDRNSLAMILRGMVEGVIAVDKNQNIVHINEAAARMLNVSMTTSLNRPVWEQVRFKEINAALEQALNENDVVESQLRLPSEQNDLVINIYVAVLVDAQQEPTGAIIVLHDISKLDRLVKIRRDFVANASHELKTPITAIKGLAETILDDKEMPEDTKNNFIEKISAQSTRLSTLVTDLISLSRLESDPDTDNFRRIEIQGLLEKSFNGAMQLCSQKNLNIEMTLNTDSKLVVMGDSHALSQLIDNLIDNAIHYTSEGGNIRLVLEEKDSQAVFTISDTGIGIAPKEQSRIFERFYRVDKARSKVLGGTGLGLSIVKNIVRQHQGAISIESQLGVGSHFQISLPLVSATEL